MAKNQKVGEPKTQVNYYERYEIFSIVRNPKTNNQTMLAIGNRLLPTVYNSEEEAKKAIKQKPWELLLDSFIIVAQFVDDMRKKEKEQNQNEEVKQ
ncbi:MAG: hypothetical protein ACI4MO_05705 [Christensenellales bacterium]